MQVRSISKMYKEELIIKLIQTTDLAHTVPKSNLELILEN